jgi:hypothetical protein
VLNQHSSAIVMHHSAMRARSPQRQQPIVHSIAKASCVLIALWSYIGPPEITPRCQDHRIAPSPLPLDPGLSIFPSSAPCPLCPRFLPGICKPKCDFVVSPVAPGPSEADSPNRERKLFFFGLGSSCRPTSSNPASSSVDLGFSKVLPLTEDLGSLMARESSDARDGKPSPCTTGDLPEMSCTKPHQCTCLQSVAVPLRKTFGMTRRIRVISKMARFQRADFYDSRKSSRWEFYARSSSSL